MDLQRIAAIESIYHGVLAKEPGERSSYLESACAGDPALRTAVESLLAFADNTLPNPLHQVDIAKVWGEIAEMTVPEELGERVDDWVKSGTTIGPYRILRLLGEGGMGAVYEAEQEQPVRRRVAVKLIKIGMDTREVVARFESERQALALMDHPAIAKVFDAGSTPQGRPYFVMEYVTGIPITQYCDQHKLTTRERLDLFIRVCEGVQHAHQKAIIHRDLKPSNILVGEVDGKPMPRIIDFGVAKATSERLTAETLFTRVGAIIGTPGYMSPEQAESTGVDVDTRTDVYSLGVVLYELLVGARPLDFQKLSFEEILRRVREDDAPRPSTRLRSLGDQSQITAQNRGTDPARLARQLRGDLDLITLKALEKERSQRYSTPLELAADIRRYLRNEPVLARPASAAYRTRKYIRRHRIAVAVAAGLVAVLISFGVAQTFQLRRTMSERDRANRERDRASRVTTFMTDMFKVSDPSAARGNTITAREILDKASKQIDTGLNRDPELKAQMMDVMGTVYERLGLYSSARPLLERSTDIRRHVLGSENPETLVSMHHLATNLFGEGRYAESEKLLRETVDIQRRVLGPEDPYRLLSMNNLATVLKSEGHYGEAEKLDRETLDIRRRVSGPRHPDTVLSMENLAGALSKQGRNAEAEKLYREALDIRRRVSGPQQPETLGLMNNLALVLDSEGQYQEAEKLDRETLDIQRRVMGPEHPYTLLTMSNLANVLADQHRDAEAEELLRRTLDIQRRVLGPEHPNTVGSMNNLATIVNDLGHYAEAEKLERQTLDIQRRVLGPRHPETLSSAYNLACFAARNGKRDEALAELRDAVDNGLRADLDLGMEKDPDLKSLHGDPRFDELVAHAKERAAAARKAH
jgi:non-specific serine/threonine protein kinase/serine/threonine-protein kinase